VLQWHGCVHVTRKLAGLVLTAAQKHNAVYLSDMLTVFRNTEHFRSLLAPSNTRVEAGTIPVDELWDHDIGCDVVQTLVSIDDCGSFFHLKYGIWAAMSGGTNSAYSLLCDFMPSVRVEIVAGTRTNDGLQERFEQEFDFVDGTLSDKQLYNEEIVRYIDEFKQQMQNINDHSCIPSFGQGWTWSCLPAVDGVLPTFMAVQC
jgi:hypothetical protein